ncbi:MAG: DUF2254 domain-containing protein, partial [Pyrinomonadaceae bacterium]|nr:DUF2254 domain-containing protein [Pyrinomonadaceae bacterium]
RIVSAFLIGPDRSFRQDPRFGLIVLSEIASRALSPGVNDPGTAIDVIGRVVRLLSECVNRADTSEDKTQFDNVYVPAVAISDLFDDVFTPIARDGASNIEVGIRLQKALLSLSRTGYEPYRQNAARHSALALKRADAALTLQEDKDILAGFAHQIGSALRKNSVAASAEHSVDQSCSTSRHHPPPKA